MSAWKIDIWAISTGECERLLGYCKAIKDQLNDNLSVAIMSIKSQCWQDPEYRRSYGSSDIYEAVLQHGVRDMDGFKIMRDRLLKLK